MVQTAREFMEQNANRCREQQRHVPKFCVCCAFNKQFLDEVFVISRIIKVEVGPRENKKGRQGVPYTSPFP